ncbi:hypothetical protein [Paenibacillus humicus]|uniref:hypothetical protein n=1 Tax=Paenibacillus humicus TaxID=412861 RepID=UPI003D2C1FBC
MLFNVNLLSQTVLLLSNTLFIVCFYPVLFKENHLTIIEIGLVFATYYIIKEIFPIIARLKAITKNKYIVAYLFLISSYLLLPQVDSFYLILFIVGINSYSGALISSCSKSFFFKDIENGFRSKKKYYDAFHTSVSLGFFLAIPIMYFSFMAGMGSWIYYPLGFVNFLILILILFKKEINNIEAEDVFNQDEFYLPPILLVSSTLSNTLTISYPMIISFISIENIHSTKYISFFMLFYGILASLVTKHSITKKSIISLQLLNNLFMISFLTVAFTVKIPTINLAMMTLFLGTVYVHLTLISSNANTGTSIRRTNFGKYGLGVLSASLLVLLPIIFDTFINK